MTPIVVTLALVASLTCPSGIVPCNAPPVPQDAVRSPYGMLWQPTARLKLPPDPYELERRHWPYMPMYPVPDMPPILGHPIRFPAGEDGKCLRASDVNRGYYVWSDCGGTISATPMGDLPGASQIIFDGTDTNKVPQWRTLTLDDLPVTEEERKAGSARRPE